MNYDAYFDTLHPQPATRRVELGRVQLPSGRIYCGDPFLGRETAALDTVLAPCTCAVDLCLVDLPDWGWRVALARLVVSAAPVVAWQVATSVFEGERRTGFQVEAGLACFMDKTTRALFAREVDALHATGPGSNYYDDVLAPLFKRNADPTKPYDAGHWALHAPVAGDERNIAMFASGLGDGVYSAHWGMDEGGQPAVLVADFGLLELETR